MKTLALAVLAGVAASANAAVLFNNGPVFDVAGSPNLSVLQSPPNTTFGYGAQGGTVNNAVADDFTVTAAAGWNVTNLRFFMYQTGANSAFTFTNISFDIVSNLAAPRAFTSVGVGASNNGGLVAYRVTQTTLGDRARAIFAIDVPVNINLAQGTYWLRWNATGTLASGPWQPPVVPQGTVGNAAQAIGAAGAFLPVNNGGTPPAPVELPFEISGTVIPAPGALALLGLGGLVAGRRRR